MKTTVRITLSLLGVLVSTLHAPAVNVRFPPNVGRDFLVSTVVVCVLLVALCFLVQQTRGFIFAAVLVGAIAIHQLTWGFDFYSQYRRFGTDTWAGDGLGVILNGFTFLPLFAILLGAVIAALVLRARERDRNGRKTAEPGATDNPGDAQHLREDC